MHQNKFACFSLSVALVSIGMLSSPTHAKSAMLSENLSLDKALSNSKTQLLFSFDVFRLSERHDDRVSRQIYSSPTSGGQNNTGRGPTIQRTAFDEFFEFFTLAERDDDKGGSRGGSFCSIAPLSPNDKPRANNFLSDRPTFVWEGEAVRIEVRPIGEDTAVWGKDLQPKERIAAYPPNSPALLPNKTYKLWFKLASGTTYDDVTFSVLSANQRQKVQSDLQQLVSQLPAAQKLNKSAIAAKQATYLGKQNLWPDAFGILFSVPQKDIPTQEQANWNKGTDAIRQSLCKPSQ